MLPIYSEYLRIIRESVMYSHVFRDKKNKEIVCKRPNSFAYIENIEQLMSPNVGIGQGKDKYYFFDRKKSNMKNPSSMTEVSYPLVALSERTFQYDYIFNVNEGHSLMNAKVFILDLLNHKTCDSNYCNNRHPVDVFQDCSSIYEGILSYLNGVSCYVYNDSMIWVNKNHYLWLLSENKCDKNGDKYSLYTESKVNQIAYLRYLRLRNKDILGRNITMEGQGALYGVMVDLNLPMYPCFNLDNNFREYEDSEIGTCGL